MLRAPRQPRRHAGRGCVARRRDADGQRLDRGTDDAAATHPLQTPAEPAGTADQYDNGGDAALAAAPFAAARPVELAVEKRDGAAGQRDRVRDTREEGRHVTKHRVDHNAGEQQQQRVVQVRQDYRGVIGTPPMSAAPPSQSTRLESVIVSETAVLLCGHGSRDPEAVGEFEAGRGRPCARASRAWRRGAISPPATSNSPGRRSARASLRSPSAARGAILAIPGHAVRGQPRQERPAVGNEQLYGRPTPASTSVSAATSGSSRTCSMPPPSASRRRCRTGALGFAARRRWPRHQRPRRQFQCRQADPDVVGGDGLWLGRDRLQRRCPPPRRCRARTRGAARLSPHRRVPVLSVHRRPGETHLRADGSGPDPVSPHRVSQGALSRRSPAGHRHLFRPYRRVGDR